MAGIREIAQRAGVPASKVTAVFEALKTILSEDVDVRISGLGTFQPHIQKARTVSSPVLPGGSSSTPRRRNIRFVISKTLRSSWEFGD